MGAQLVGNGVARLNAATPLGMTGLISGADQWHRQLIWPQDAAETQLAKKFRYICTDGSRRISLPLSGIPPFS